MSDAKLRDAFEKAISGAPYEREVDRFPNDESTAWPGNYRDDAVDLAWCVLRDVTAELLEGQRKALHDLAQAAANDKPLKMALEALAESRKKLEQLEAKLKDPMLVYVAMLRKEIATPAPERLQTLIDGMKA